jgi:hypothetical protein
VPGAVGMSGKPGWRRRCRPARAGRVYEIPGAPGSAFAPTFDVCPETITGALWGYWPRCDSSIRDHGDLLDERAGSER